MGSGAQRAFQRSLHVAIDARLLCRRTNNVSPLLHGAGRVRYTKRVEAHGFSSWKTRNQKGHNACQRRESRVAHTDLGDPRVGIEGGDQWDEPLLFRNRHNHRKTRSARPSVRASWISACVHRCTPAALQAVRLPTAPDATSTDDDGSRTACACRIPGRHHPLGGHVSITMGTASSDVQEARVNGRRLRDAWRTDAGAVRRD
jgi:hypothetical protein